MLGFECLDQVGNGESLAPFRLFGGRVRAEPHLGQHVGSCLAGLFGRQRPNLADCRSALRDAPAAAMRPILDHIRHDPARHDPHAKAGKIAIEGDEGLRSGR
jgi:hypothetical protein